MARERLQTRQQIRSEVSPERARGARMRGPGPASEQAGRRERASARDAGEAESRAGKWKESGVCCRCARQGQRLPLQHQQQRRRRRTDGERSLTVLGPRRRLHRPATAATTTAAAAATSLTTQQQEPEQQAERRPFRRCSSAVPLRCSRLSLQPCCCCCCSREQVCRQTDRPYLYAPVRTLLRPLPLLCSACALPAPECV